MTVFIQPKDLIALLRELTGKTPSDNGKFTYCMSDCIAILTGIERIPSDYWKGYMTALLMLTIEEGEFWLSTIIIDHVKFTKMDHHEIINLLRMIYSKNVALAQRFVCIQFYCMPEYRSLFEEAGCNDLVFDVTNSGFRLTQRFSSKDQIITAGRPKSTISEKFTWASLGKGHTTFSESTEWSMVVFSEDYIPAQSVAPKKHAPLEIW
jgi:hypothetical protein